MPASKNEQLTVNCCISDLDNALTQLLLARGTTDENSREDHLVRARSYYELARSVPAPVDPYWAMTIRRKIERIEQALAEHECLRKGPKRAEPD